MRSPPRFYVRGTPFASKKTAIQAAKLVSNMQGRITVLERAMDELAAPFYAHGLGEMKAESERRILLATRALADRGVPEMVGIGVGTVDG